MGTIWDGVSEEKRGEKAEGKGREQPSAQQSCDSSPQLPTSPAIAAKPRQLCRSTFDGKTRKRPSFVSTLQNTLDMGRWKLPSS